MTSSKQQTQTQSTQGPWSVQQPYLTTAFNGAQTALNQANANGSTSTYGAPTQFTSQYTPAMMDAFRAQLGYADPNSPLGSVPTNTAAAAGGVLSSGMNATNKGLFGLAGFTPTGGVDANIAAGNKYADANAGIVPGIVAGAMRDANQNYTDIQRPGMDRNAVAGGNTNSSTRDISKGIVERGLAQKAADISAQTRGQLFQTGATLNEDQDKSQTTALLQSLLGLTSGGTGAVNSGTYAGTGSVGQQTGLFNIANTGASNLNAGNQADLTNQAQAFTFGQNSPFAALNNFYNLIGNKSWGSEGSSNSTTTSTPSTLQTIGQIAGMAGSLFGGGGLFPMGGGGGISGIFGSGGSPVSAGMYGGVPYPIYG